MHLDTFQLPEVVLGTPSDIALGRDMVSAWQSDGIFQVAVDSAQDRTVQRAVAASRRFFSQSFAVKSRFVSELTYSGYVASGEEMTDGKADASEIFTVCKDVPLDDARVRAGWPCHGPVPWPDDDYRQSMQALMAVFGAVGDRLLRLVALGLRLDDIDALTALAVDGWHHMRVLRFPPRSERNSRGIGAHTDYGMLVIATQDDVGGLHVRPPIEGERRNRNWRVTESSAGMYEDDERWSFVPPMPRVFTTFPGDILQFLSGSALLSTPHKVTLAARERFAMAYFHEPNFTASVRPLGDPASDEVIHYGSHFTSMFVRCYPERATTRRLLDENRLSAAGTLGARGPGRRDTR